MRKIDDLIYYCEKKAGLLKDLKLSLTIEKFYPEAFKHGTCNIYVTGNPHHKDNVRVRFKRINEYEEVVDEVSYHPKELPEEILSIPNVKSALLSLSNRKRLVPKDDHNFHSGIYLS